MIKKHKSKTVPPLPSAVKVAAAKPIQEQPVVSGANSERAISATTSGIGTAIRGKKRGKPAELTPPGSSTPAAEPAGEKSLVDKYAALRVRFVLLEPEAKEVSLCGSFNGWSPEGTPMTRRKDGQWDATVGLVPGRHEYKFVVDGQWMPDLAASENVLNQFGTLNSVRVVPGPV
jgi:hypothetical protein